MYEYVFCKKKEFVGTRAQSKVLGLGPWALSKDIDKPEEERIATKGFPVEISQVGYE